MNIAELFKHWTYQVFAPGTLLRTKYNAFKKLLALDDECLDLIADIEEIAYGQVQADWARMTRLAHALLDGTTGLVGRLQTMNPTRYLGLPEYQSKIGFYVRMGLDLPEPDLAPPHVITLSEAADLPGQAGGKANKTGLVAAETYLNVPQGFVVTATAFNYFLESGGLRPRIDAKLSLAVLDRPQDLLRVCEDIQALIQEAEVPGDMAEAMLEQAELISSKFALKSGRLAVRSSAVGEDDELSFAGQYDSILGVSPSGILGAYKQVLASKYSVRAVTYRILHGLPDEHTPMAVLVMPEVEARAAGVVYTRDRDRAGTMRGVTSVYAVNGPGEQLVSGRANPEIWCLTGEAEPMVLQEPGGHDPGDGAVLTEDQALELGRAAHEIEELFGAPQDIEWVLDADGTLHVVQARPMRTGGLEISRDAPEVEPDAPLLLQDGAVASGGAASGPVVRLERERDPDLPEPGAILCTPALWPSLAGLAGRVAGVVAQAGSRASHFASVARELGLPVLVHPEAGSLEPGRIITLDAYAGRVFDGRVESLLAKEPGPDRDNLALARLGKVLPLMVKLNLTDPEAEDFTPEGCRSLHDVVRFCHEKAVSEMFSLVGRSGRGLGQAKKLESRLPIVLYVLDLDQGLFEAARDKAVIAPDDIKSPPMWALWNGLAGEEVHWDQNMPHMDWGEFDRIAGGIFKKDSKLLASYAVLSADYMHLMIRFGYHFSLVDALCGPDSRSNYVNFRFKGGGGDMGQRELRLGFIRAVLEDQGFSVTTRGDLLDATFTRFSEAETQLRLTTLGRLLARTRLMDMGLEGPEQVEELVRDFLERKRPHREDF